MRSATQPCGGNIDANAWANTVNVKEGRLMPQDPNPRLIMNPANAVSGLDKVAIPWTWLPHLRSTNHVMHTSVLSRGIESGSLITPSTLAPPRGYAVQFVLCKAEGEKPEVVTFHSRAGRRIQYQTSPIAFCTSVCRNFMELI